MEENIIQINGGITINADVSVKNMYLKKIYIWNPDTYSCGNGKYLASIMVDPAITCDEIIKSYNEETKTILTNFNEKKATCKRQFFYFTCIFINYYNIIDSFSVYCYLIKYQAKQKHLLSFPFPFSSLQKYK